MKLSKSVLALGLVAVLFGSAGVYTTYVQKAEAQGSTSVCSSANIKVVPVNFTNTTVSSSGEDVPVYKFKVSNTNTGATCTFWFKNIHLQELLSSNGSVLSDLQIQYNGTNIGNELEVGKYFGEMIYEYSVNDINQMNTTIYPGTSKVFTVIAHELDSPSDHGDSFALGVEFIQGHLGMEEDEDSLIPVNNWYTPAKWGQIMFLGN